MQICWVFRLQVAATNIQFKTTNPRLLCTVSDHLLEYIIAEYQKTWVTKHNSVVWPVPYACAQPYHPSSGSHGQLFRPCWASSAWHSQAPVRTRKLYYCGFYSAGVYYRIYKRVCYRLGYKCGKDGGDVELE